MLGFCESSRYACVSNQPAKPKSSISWPAKDNNHNTNNAPLKMRSQCSPVGGTALNQKDVHAESHPGWCSLTDRGDLASTGAGRLLGTMFLSEAANQFVHGALRGIGQIHKSR